jgi:hypothetical protein
MQNTPFDNQLATTQGRLEPGLVPAADGSWVWCMGMDLSARAEVIAYGDYVQIEQQIDVTDITYLKAQVFFRQPQNLDERTLANDIEVVALNSSTISNVTTGGGPGVPIRVTTVGKHYLVTGETVTIAGVLGAINANGTFTVTVIDDFNFDLDGVEGSGTYTSGGSLGRGERLYLPAGWTVEEYQGVIDMTGSSFGDNNGAYRILGFQEQPGVSPPTLAWVERPNVGALTADDVATSPSIAAVRRGTRWKVSLLVDSGGGFKERARVVQQISQGGFFRTDLGAYVRRLSGEHSFALRATMIQHEPTNVYDLPVQP